MLDQITIDQITASQTQIDLIQIKISKNLNKPPVFQRAIMIMNIGIRTKISQNQYQDQNVLKIMAITTKTTTIETIKTTKVKANTISNKILSHQESLLKLSTM